MEGFGIQNHTAGISAAGAVMHYLSETQHDKLQHITRINPISQGSYVWLDHFTQRNLELFRPKKLYIGAMDPIPHDELSQ